MFRFCTAGLLRPGGLGQARGAEALISALGARREARVAAPRLGAPRPTLVFRVFLAAQLLSPGPLSGFRVTRQARSRRAAGPRGRRASPLHGPRAIHHGTGACGHRHTPAHGGGAGCSAQGSGASLCGAAWHLHVLHLRGKTVMFTGCLGF